MLQAADDAAFTKAAAAADRRPLLNLGVTRTVAGAAVPVDVGAAESVEIEATLDGTADSDALLGGAVSATGTVTLSQQRDSDGATVFDVWHPSSTAPAAIPAVDQPGIAVAVAWGFDGQTVPGYDGRVREVQWDEARDQVLLELLDSAPRFGAAVTLPAEGSRDVGAVFGDPHRAPVNSAAVAAHVFDACGYASAPPVRPGCIFSLPGVGGWLPNYGWTTPLGNGYPTAELFDTTSRFVAGPCGPAQLPPQTAGEAAGWRGRPRNRLTLASDGSRVPDARVSSEQLLSQVLLPSTTFAPGGLLFSAFVRTAADGVAEVAVAARQNGNALSIARNGTTLIVTAGGEGGFDPTSTSNATKWTLPAGWHYVEVSLDGGIRIGESTNAMWIRIDGVDRGKFNPTAAQSSLSGDNLTVDYSCTATPVQAVQLHAGTWRHATDTPPWLTTLPWTPKADIAVGRLDIDCLPVVQDVRGWDVLKDLAVAEYGTAGVDETGRASWRDRDQVNPAPTAPVATVTTDQTARAGSVSLDDVANVVTAKVTPRKLRNRGVGGGDNDVSEAALMLPPLTEKDGVVDGENRVRFAAQSTTVVVLETDRPVVPYDQFVGIYQAPGVGYNNTGIALCEDIAGNTRFIPDFPTQVTASIDPMGAKRLRLAVRNTAFIDLFGVWPREWSSTRPYSIALGQPSLIVHGWTGLDDDETTETTVTARDQASLTRYGQLAREIPTSDWWTSVGAAQAAVDRTLLEVKSPRPKLNDITVPADPRRQIGDVLGLTHPGGRLRTITARIVTVHRVATSSAAFTDTYSLRALSW